ncbi:DUF3598 family protein [Aerosakkonemataceae cyanobacterium BLCC-F50]|uniref:DUF3598 family protein n=1 Tax=Floridaenema flaviceps BLCC-F50 TaxID=3153642 RepID=A0ABV4XUT7_9CYAN
MDTQLQNWDNFCRYHATGDWHGTWTTYSPKGEVIKSFKGIRSLQASEDGSEINHHNYYTYADGKSESKTFGPYKQPNTIALFLDNSFSWGSTNVESGSNFGFETGFRYEDKRASVVVLYDGSGSLQRITIIPEHLASFAGEPSRPPVNGLSGNWQGTLKTMTSDLIVSPLVATSWNRLEDLGEDYLTLHFPDGISLSCPQQLERGKKFFMAVDWLVNSTLLQRGIRHYELSGFTGFTLELFIRSCL